MIGKTKKENKNKMALEPRGINQPSSAPREFSIIAYTSTGYAGKGYLFQVSGILKGSDFNIESTYQRFRKGSKRRN